MGRGRAKAKQTKVARELKYRSMDTDFSSLARELRGSEEGGPEVPAAYADLVEKPSEPQYVVPPDEELEGLRRSG